jgi:hypothetical protein
MFNKTLHNTKLHNIAQPSPTQPDALLPAIALSISMCTVRSCVDVIKKLEKLVQVMRRVS